MQIGFAAGEVMMITGAPDGDPDKMIGRLIEIAESRVIHKQARLRSDHTLVIDVPMQLVCKPRAKDRNEKQVPLGAWPLAWMRPYEGGRAKPRDVAAINDPTHLWLVLDPEGAMK